MFDARCSTSAISASNFWDGECPPIEGLSFSVPAPDGTGGKAIDCAAQLDRPAQSVDQRLKMPRWMDELERRGGKVELHEATLADLERYAHENDLVIVAAGKGEIAGCSSATRSARPTTSRSARSRSPT